MKTENRTNGRENKNASSNSGATGRRSGSKNGERRLGEKEWMQRAVAKVAEHWWKDASPITKAVVMNVAGMIDELTESKRIEVRLEGKAIRVRFIHLLKRPEAGCLSAIMLPELPSGRGWN